MESSRKINMKYASVCSGVEAASLAWMPLGWEPVWFSEIEPFPCEVLAQRFPEVPNLGDMTKIEGEKYRGTIDLIVGGTPCQGFSLAGKRGGLDDPRSGLCIAYCRLLKAMRPRWFIWENVPGVFSTNGGEDFRAFLREIDEIGYSCAWRVLDAQYVRVDGYPRAVPQRRRRVFIVGYLGDWRYSASVLLEPDCLFRNTPPRRIKGVEASGSLAIGAGGTSAKEQQYNCVDGIGKPLNPPGCTWWNGEQVADTLTCTSNEQRMPDKGKMQMVVVNPRCPTDVANRSTVRRLTPRECERLMGFQDDYTRIPWRGKPVEKCPDNHRYKACGNSMCVNVMRWIGMRIEMVERKMR